MVAVADIFFQGVGYQELQLLVELIGHGAKIQSPWHKVPGALKRYLTAPGTGVPAIVACRLFVS